MMFQTYMNVFFSTRHMKNAGNQTFAIEKIYWGSKKLFGYQLYSKYL